MSGNGKARAQRKDQERHPQSVSAAVPKKQKKQKNSKKMHAAAATSDPVMQEQGDTKIPQSQQPQHTQEPQPQQQQPHAPQYQNQHDHHQEQQHKVRRKSMRSESAGAHAGGKAPQGPPMVKRRRYAFALGSCIGAAIAMMGMLSLQQHGIISVQPKDVQLPGGLNFTVPLPIFQADLVSVLQMHLTSGLNTFSGLNLTVALPSISMPVPDWFSVNTTMWEVLAQLPGMGDQGTGYPESETLLRPGKQLFSKGYRAKHPVVIIPGFVTSGLELWEGKPCATKYFRQRMWGTLSMMQTYLKNSACWFEHMSLDLETGLDPEGVKIRAAQGLEAVDFFVQGYWVWGKLVEALADVGYDVNNLITAAFDWRLAIPLMEARDGWFTRLRYQIESLLDITGQKVVLTSHSYGENVARSFMHWADERQPGWLEAHVEAHVAIAGTTLGVPKAVTAVLSGEMRDTAQLGALASYLTNNLIPREARVKLFRSWASVLAMFPVGGLKVWGNGTWAPDDTKEMREMGRTFGAFLTSAPLKDPEVAASEEQRQQEAFEKMGNHGGTGIATESSHPAYPAHKGVHAGRVQAAGEAAQVAGIDPGIAQTTAEAVLTQSAGAKGIENAQSLDMRQAIDAALEAAGPRYRAHYAEWGAVHQHSANIMQGKDGSNTSVADAILRRIAGTVQQAQSATAGARTSEGMRKTIPERLALFPNALTTPLPAAPSVKIYCMYGTGLPTERSYHYLHPYGWTPGAKDEGDIGDAPCSSKDSGQRNCSSSSSSSNQDQGSSDKFRINTEVHDPDRGLDSGIQMQEDGDVTVPLISLGLMCHKGWRSKRLNPANMHIVSREYKHVQVSMLRDPRGGPASGQHVDILGNEEMLSDVLRVATGHGDEVQDRIVSRIDEIARNIDFEDPNGWD